MSLDRVRLSLVLATPFLLPSLAPAQSPYFWSRTYDGAAQQSDWAIGLAMGPQGEVFVSGASSNGLNQDALVLAYDAVGQLLWERRIDLGQNEAVGALLFDPVSGALYASGVGYPTVSAAETGLLWRLDPQSGAIVWQQTYAGPLQQGVRFGAWSLAVDSAGGPVVGGYVGPPSQHDVLVARFDSSGTLGWVWSAPTPGTQYGYAQGIAISPNGEVHFRAVEALVSDNRTQHTLRKLSAAGVPLWSRVLGTSSSGCSGPILDAASNVLYSIDDDSAGMGNQPVIAKLDPAGNPIWSVDAQTIFGAGSSTYGLVLDSQGDIVVGSSTPTIARLDAFGGLLWTASVPTAAWFDFGSWSGLQLAANGDTLLRLHGGTPVDGAAYDSIARFDSAGQFLWSQSIRNSQPDFDVRTSGMVVAPQGSVVIAGSSQPHGSLPAASDIFVAAVHEQSHATCFGDGSSGPCPCNNNSPAGWPGGCRRSGSTFGARLDDQGIASLASDSLRFYAQFLISNGVRVLIQGQVGTAPLARQDGLTCVTSPLLRMYTSTSISPDADLPPAGSQNVHTRSAALGDPILPGSSRAYQMYYRGAVGLCAAGNGNFSNSIVVDWAP